MTERELIEGCLNENLVFQEKLYRLFSSKMMGVCLRYAPSREEAEDILQEGFIKVFDHLKEFKFNGSLEGWIRKIVVNTAISFFHQDKWNKLGDDIEHVSEVEMSQNEAISSRLNANDLLKLINEIPPGYKVVFNLFAIEGYSHKEISEMLKISETTSRSQYHKAKIYLQKKLTDYIKTI